MPETGTLEKQYSPEAIECHKTGAPNVTELQTGNYCMLLKIFQLNGGSCPYLDVGKTSPHGAMGACTFSRQEYDRQKLAEEGYFAD